MIDNKIAELQINSNQLQFLNEQIAKIIRDKSAENMKVIMHLISKICAAKSAEELIFFVSEFYVTEKFKTTINSKIGEFQFSEQSIQIILKLANDIVSDRSERPFRRTERIEHLSELIDEVTSEEELIAYLKSSVENRYNTVSQNNILTEEGNIIKQQIKLQKGKKNTNRRSLENKTKKIRALDSAKKETKVIIKTENNEISLIPTKYEISLAAAIENRVNKLGSKPQQEDKINTLLLADININEFDITLLIQDIRDSDNIDSIIEYLLVYIDLHSYEDKANDEPNQNQANIGEFDFEEDTPPQHCFINIESEDEDLGEELTDSEASNSPRSPRITHRKHISTKPKTGPQDSNQYLPNKIDFPGEDVTPIPGIMNHFLLLTEPAESLPPYDDGTNIASVSSADSFEPTALDRRSETYVSGASNDNYYEAEIIRCG